jgi:transcriptional regulator with XRE-family HTH domain
MKAALTVGARIRELRKRRGLTQEELASRCCLSVSHVSMLERGHRSPSYETLLALAQVLEVPPGALFPQPESAFPAAVERLTHFIHHRGLTAEGVALAEAAFPATKSWEVASAPA